MFITHLLRLLGGASLLLLLTACGSGGGGDTGNGPVDDPPSDDPPPSADAEPLLRLDYNELVDGLRVRDRATDEEYPVSNAFNAPELVPGVEGEALRTDGYSTWISEERALDVNRTLTVETWVALESYPSDEEVPHQQLSPSSFINQRNDIAGFSLDINTFGQWEFVVYLDGQRHTLKAEEPFPLYQWAHIAAVVDTPNGNIKLYLNGEEIAEQSVATDSDISLAGGPLVIGKSRQDKFLGIFLVNALNGAFDETRIYPGARTRQHILDSMAENVEQVDGDAHESLIVPESRFAGDLQRPRLHAMPPANWTNEPHGLVRVNDRYHMFYQRTPNGPFKTQMHWGHMFSDDLVHWQHEKDALWPTLEDSDTSGYDMKGIWSGDVVYEDGTAHAFYTNVNHSGPYNPGVALATSTQANLRDWEKQGPLVDTTYVEDFRDPYLWKEGGTWHMIIGARVNGGGGLDYYTSSNLFDWSHQSRFAAPSYAQMDIGSAIWEMPVFEALGDGKHILVVNPIGGEVSKYDEEKATRGVYWTGTWENGRFTPDYLTPKNLDVIPGHLSPTVTRNEDGTLVGIGIVDERRSSQAQLDAGWTHTFSFPRQWKLMEDGETLGQEPVGAHESLRDPESHEQLSPGLVPAGEYGPVAKGRMKEVVVEVDPETAPRLYGVVLGASEDGTEKTRLYYDSDNQQLVLDKRDSSTSSDVEDKRIWRGDYDEAAFGKVRKLHVFVDHSVVDVFINEAAAFSVRIYPEGEDSDHVYLFSQGGETDFTNVESWTLKQPQP